MQFVFALVVALVAAFAGPGANAACPSAIAFACLCCFSWHHTSQHLPGGLWRPWSIAPRTLWQFAQRLKMIPSAKTSATIQPYNTTAPIRRVLEDDLRTNRHMCSERNLKYKTNPRIESWRSKRSPSNVRSPVEPLCSKQYQSSNDTLTSKRFPRIEPCRSRKKHSSSKSPVELSRSKRFASNDHARTSKGFPCSELIGSKRRSFKDTSPNPKRCPSMELLRSKRFLSVGDRLGSKRCELSKLHRRSSVGACKVDILDATRLELIAFNLTSSNA